MAITYDCNRGRTVLYGGGGGEGVGLYEGEGAGLYEGEGAGLYEGERVGRDIFHTMTS